MLNYDAILDATGPAQVAGENNDLNSINVLEDFKGGAAKRIAAIRSGSWDAGEYGISAEQAIAQIEAAQTPEAFAKVEADLKARALRRASLSVNEFGKVEFASAFKPGWHGLGVTLDRLMNSKEAALHSGLNQWKVLKVQHEYEFNGATRESKRAYSLVRSDNGRELAVVGNRYQVFQNDECFGFLDEVVNEFGGHYETAGAIFGGEKIFMMVQFPDKAFEPVAGDKVEPWIALVNPHGYGKVHVYPTEVRHECANTVRIGLSKKGKKGIGIRHTGNLKEKVAAAQRALGLAVRSFDVYREKTEFLAAKPVGDVRAYAAAVIDESAILDITAADAALGAGKLVEAMMLTTQVEIESAQKQVERQLQKRENMIEEILARYDSPANAKLPDSAWRLVNAATEQANHSRGRQSRDAEVAASRRFESILAGDADRINQAALAVALR